MNQGGNTQTVAQLDPNSYATSWTTHTTVENQPVENGNYANSNYYHPPQPTVPAATGNVQETTNTANVTTQDYSGYTSYQTTNDPQNYSNYYCGYQQQQPSQQTYQNTGATYQPSQSSYPQSYAGTASYSGTYYNPADYQTQTQTQTTAGGSYQSTTNYSNQTPGGYQTTNYTNYTSNPYQNYATDASQSSTVATTAPVNYQQNYQQQWANYYSQTEVPCAPGTEKVTVSNAYSQSFPVPVVTSEVPGSNGQPASSYAQPWSQQTNSSQPPPQQPGGAVSTSNDTYWMHQATQSLQVHHPVPPQTHYQAPMETKPLYETPYQGHPRPTYAQQLKSQPSFHQTPLSYHQPTQTAPSLDTQRVSKVQIPTNPRIASNLPSGFTKDSSAAGTPQAPAYVSVSMPKPKDHPTPMLEPGSFPKSLRGFVERAFARCKDDKERASCKAALAEIVTKTTEDGTLHTRDWDTEPLLTVLHGNVTNTESSSTLTSSLQNKSPTRRVKSRWEPIQEAKPFVKPAPAFTSPVNFGGWNNHQIVNNNKFIQSQTIAPATSFIKPTYPGQNPAKKIFQRPVKRQRFSTSEATTTTTTTTTVDDEASSDSDDKDITPYYSTAMALASSAEEKKRRDSRSKRFEKVQGHNNHRGKDIPKPKNVPHVRTAATMRLSRNFDESSNSRAVEDIDWDALTVKGTCQEIEKRYLRLTSAPDPSTVRPEDVLEKALLMVQDSQKNYLFKCDQLKSIRQDLTVQRIYNHLTAKVYETHARLALEAGDLPEYNQCLSQLKILYADGIEGCSLEFAAYSLLYITLHSNNNRELLSSMSRLSIEAKRDEAVRHALSVRSAVTSGNYVMFFRLYKNAPNMNSCLMDLYVEKMRYKAVTFMSRSCRPTIPVSYLVQVLGFSGETERDGMDECSEWLKSHGASLITESNGDMLLDTKASTSNLFMPEPEDAVAHGDRNLDVNDFFTRT